MEKNKTYKTKQKDLILRVLNGMRTEHTTAEDLAALLRGRGEEVGLATIYRNLEKLVQEGLVLKYTLPGGLSACYQLLSGCGGERHSHLICTSCGAVSHLGCNEMDVLDSHLSHLHRFTLDRQKTVLYGLCLHCTGLPESAEHAHCCHTQPSAKEIL